MMKSFLRLVVMALICSSAWANVELKANHPQQYYVKDGDTLWDISSLYLQDPWLWPEIWHINPQLENPHLIYPGDLLKLVYIDGKPALTVKRGEQSRTIKLSPTARITPLDTVIPAIPLDRVQSFLTESRVVSKELLEDSSYVIAGSELHIIMGVGDRFYARGDWSEPQAAYGVYRPGEAYVDPDSSEVLGYDAKELGMGKWIREEEGIATLELIRSGEEVRVGDRLLATEQRRVESIFYPKSPKQEVNGKIISVLSGVKNVSQFDVVVINKGFRENMQVGHVLAIYRRGEQVRDTYTDELLQLPSERAGILMVFRTFEKVSYGLVLKATSSMSILDEVRNP
ncbi:MAG: peptidoglycan-binding protein [Gammaproteobacteria bacterium]|nr:MAG: peptidoglycan-binding protein [Gammaproteobacteria bacterium]